METIPQTEVDPFEKQDTTGAGGGVADDKGGGLTPSNEDKLSAALEKISERLDWPQETKKEEQKLTPEQEKQLWAIYNPGKTNPKFHSKFFRLPDDATPEQVKEYQDMLADFQKGLVKQSVVGARNLAQIEFQKLRDEFAPVLKFYQEEQNRKTAESFYKAFPALGVQDESGNYRFSRVLAAAADSIKDQTFKSRDEYFKALAESAADTIKGVLPEFDLGAAPKTKPATKPGLPRTRVGGTGGTGAGGHDEPVFTGRQDQAGSLDFMKAPGK